MPKFDFIEDAENYFDVEAEAEFGKSLDNFDAAKILTMILDVLAHPKFKHLTGILVGLEVNETIFKVRFRYLHSTLKTSSSNITSQESEDRSRQTMQVIFYLFAKIDTLYTLENTPFPPDFRKFLSLPDEI